MSGLLAVTACADSRMSGLLAVTTCFKKKCETVITLLQYFETDDRPEGMDFV
jgi:hypothetical protein